MAKKRERPVGRRMLTDPSAESSASVIPAFLAKPKGAPVYYGFPVIEETLTEGWLFGAITAFDDDPEGRTFGDGFVIAPDGSRAGIVWEVGEFATREICAPTSDRWGVYGVAFPHAVRCISDLVEGFRAVMPELQGIHARIVGVSGQETGEADGKPKPTTRPRR